MCIRDSRWFGLKTFTGMQHKYVTPKKWPPVVFALADEDAFAYCDKNPCVPVSYTHLDVYKRQVFAVGPTSA